MATPDIQVLWKEALSVSLIECCITWVCPCPEALALISENRLPATSQKSSCTPFWQGTMGQEFSTNRYVPAGNILSPGAATFEPGRNQPLAANQFLQCPLSRYISITGRKRRPHGIGDPRLFQESLAIQSPTKSYPPIRTGSRCICTTTISLRDFSMGDSEIIASGKLS